MLEKKGFIVLLLISFGFLGFSQDTIRLMIIDETETLLRIEDDVRITIQQTGESHTYSSNSFIIVNDFKSYNLIIKAGGYQTQAVVYHKENLNGVQYVALKPKFSITSFNLKPQSNFTGEDLTMQGMPTIGDALANKTGVWLTRPNHMNNAISIRGLSGNQNRILFNDIPLNNAIMGNRNNQARDWLNVFPIGEVAALDIVRSPNTSTMGGTINIETRMPDYYGGTNITGYGDVRMALNGDRIVNGGIDYGRENMALTASLTRNTLGIINGISGIEHTPTSYRQLGGNVRGLVYLGRGELEFGYHGTVNNGDLVLAQNMMDEFLDPFTNQLSHQMAYAKFNYISRKGWFRVINLKGAYQRMSEQTTLNPYQQFQSVDENGVHSGWLSITGTSNLGEGWKGFTTLEWREDQILRSTSSIVDTLDDDTFDRVGRYPSDGRASSLTLSHRQVFSKRRLELHGGIEGNLTTLRGTTNRDTFTVQPFSFSAYTEAHWLLNFQNKLTAHVSYNYRPLSFEDMPYLGFETYFSWATRNLPNADLKTERSLHFEIGHRFDGHRFNSSLSFFRSQLFNGIQTVITFQGFEYAEFSFENVMNGFIHGIEGEFNVLLSSDFQLKGNISYQEGQLGIEGEERVDNSAVPPLFGRLALRYRNDKKISSELAYQFAGNMTRVPLSDPLYQFVEDGLSRNWHLLNWSIGYEFSGIQINGGIRNIFGVEYFRFGSYIPDYNRNFWIGIRVNG